MRDEVRRIEQEIAVAEEEEEERRAKDCKVCGEPYCCPCIVDVHEKAARDDELRSMATWLRSSEALAIVYDTVSSSTESVVEACRALAKAIDGGAARRAGGR